MSYRRAVVARRRSATLPAQVAEWETTEVPVERDLDDVPDAVRAELRIHPVVDVAEVLELALEPTPTTGGRRLTH